MNSIEQAIWNDSEVVRSEKIDIGNDVWWEHTEIVTNDGFHYVFVFDENGELQNVVPLD